MVCTPVRSTLSASAALVLSAALAGALAACGPDAEAPDPGPTPTASQTSAAAPTELSFGEAQTVTWGPTDDRSTELSLQVVTVSEGRAADFEGLAAAGISKDNQPYYVNVVIGNDGEADIGGLDVPLYLVDSSQTLTPPSKFADAFEPCPSGPLPSPFGAGAEAQMCLVFFSSIGATFQSITFQPDVDAAAVAWTGDVAVPAQKPPRKRVRDDKERR